MQVKPVHLSEGEGGEGSNDLTKIANKGPKARLT